MEWHEIVIALVALYGAGLSTYIALSERKDKMRKVKIDLSRGFIGRGEQTEDALIIKMVNPGIRSVTIRRPTISLPGKKKFLMADIGTNVKFPYELEEGKSCTAWIFEDIFYKELIKSGYSGKIKIRAVCLDQVDNKYSSKKIEFTL